MFNVDLSDQRRSNSAFEVEQPRVEVYSRYSQRGDELRAIYDPTDQHQTLGTGLMWRGVLAPSHTVGRRLE